MSRETTMKRILDCGIVAVVRADSGERLAQVVKALAAGGVDTAEITFTVPDAIVVIRQFKPDQCQIETKHAHPGGAVALFDMAAGRQRL